MDDKLPFPTKRIVIQGQTVEEYAIPDDKKGDVLEQLYPFEGVPSLHSTLFDLHEGKKFVVRDFRVMREHGMNWLVSPYHPRSGGSVIDWMPEECADEQ